jgi:hypothetical protein
MSKELKIEAGKYYRRRDGHRVYVIATNKPGINPIIGWSDSGWMLDFLPTGKVEIGADNNYDIVSEWTEPDRIPWEHLPKWCKWWVHNADGQEWGTEKEPTHNGISWTVNDGKSGCIRIPRSLNSNYTGDWRQSLRERPEGA